MSYYEVSEELDKFTNTTTIRMNRSFEDLGARSGYSFFGVSLSLWSVQSSGKTDSIFIKYYNRETDLIGGYSGTEGKNMIIRINDNENISLPFGSEDCSVSKKFNEVRQMYYNEYRVYNSVEINKMILEKICNATSIEFSFPCGEYTTSRLSAERLQGFINYCRIFYNGLYNEDKYQVDKEIKMPSKPKLSISYIIKLIIALSVSLFIPVTFVISCIS